MPPWRVTAPGAPGVAFVPMVHAEAHARVNLMGEHTDYNAGLVLPTLLPHRTSVELTPRDDDRARIASEGFGGGEFVVGEERAVHGWLDYAEACTATLRADGHEVRGFDARVSSDVPVGAGVSSSAALLLALLRALREAFALAIDDVSLALTAQRAEVEFVGARVGIMDQMVASVGREGAALFLDTADLRRELIPLGPSIGLALVDSGVRHAHAGGSYNERRAECEMAAKALGVPTLREVDDLTRVDALEPALAKRVRHVVAENERVLEAVNALRADDAGSLGALFDASHASQRDDFDVSTPEIDALREALREVDGIRGARLTGGGFGGAVVAVCDPVVRRRDLEPARRAYERRSGREATVLLPVR